MVLHLYFDGQNAMCFERILKGAGEKVNKCETEWVKKGCL